MLILQCILVLQSQSIDFTNAFAQADIPSGGKDFIDLLRGFNSDWGQCDVVIRLNKRLYGQAEAARLWHEKLWNGLLDSRLVVIKVDPCLVMSKTVICVVFVENFLSWARSQYDIDNVMKSFK